MPRKGLAYVWCVRAGVDPPLQTMGAVGAVVGKNRRRVWEHVRGVLMPSLPTLRHYQSCFGVPLENVARAFEGAREDYLRRRAVKLAQLAALAENEEE